MPASTHEVIRPLSDWLVRGIRFTFFPCDWSVFPVADWWEAFAGEAADRVVNQPKECRVLAQGKWQDGELSVRAQPVRVDVNWKAVSADGPPDPPEMCFLGEARNTIAVFSQAVASFLRSETLPPVSRLAFACDMALEAENDIEARKTLKQYLPTVDFDPEVDTEMLWRINRRRPSTCNVEGLQVNRLSIWRQETVRLESVILQLMAENTQRVDEEPKEAVYCVLSLDINTTPQHSTPFADDALPGLMQELENLGVEIALRGDIR